MEMEYSVQSSFSIGDIYHTPDEVFNAWPFCGVDVHRKRGLGGGNLCRHQEE